MSDSKKKKLKEDDSLTSLKKYLKSNKEKAYDYATKNTKYNEQGHPTISTKDEWASETEWDDLFATMKKEKLRKGANE